MIKDVNIKQVCIGKGDMIYVISEDGRLYLSHTNARGRTTTPIPVTIEVPDAPKPKKEST